MKQAPIVLTAIKEDDAFGIRRSIQPKVAGEQSPILALLVAWRADLDERMRKERDDVQMRRLQGASLAVEDILSEFERVSDVQRPAETRS